MSSQAVEQGVATTDYLDFLAGQAAKARALRGNEARNLARRRYLPGVFVLAVACIRGEGSEISSDLERQTGTRFGLGEEVLRSAKTDMFEQIKPDLVNRNDRWEQMLNPAAVEIVKGAVSSDAAKLSFYKRLPGLGNQLDFIANVVATEADLTGQANVALAVTIGREK